MGTEGLVFGADGFEVILQCFYEGEEGRVEERGGGIYSRHESVDVFRGPLRVGGVRSWEELVRIFWGVQGGEEEVGVDEGGDSRGNGGVAGGEEGRKELEEVKGGGDGVERRVL